MNIRVEKLIVKSPRSIRHYSPDHYSPVEYHNMIQPGTDMCIFISGDYNTILNYGQLVNDFLEIRRDNWTIFAGQLTEKLIQGYEIKEGFYNDGHLSLSKPVGYYYCCTKDYQVEYARADNQETGVYSNRFLCHDLKITLPEEVDKKRVLVFSNNFPCYTVPGKHDHSVFAYRGADYVANSPNTPDITYLDFGKVGDVVCVPLSFKSAKAKVIIRSRRDEDHQEVTNYNGWTIVLDEKYKLSEYTAIVIINHFLVLPNMYEVICDNALTIDIRKLALEQSALAVSRLSGESMDESERCIKTNAYKKIQEQLSKPDNRDSFIVLVKGKLCVDTQDAHRTYSNSITAEEGVLYDRNTGSILGEIRAHFKTGIMHHLNAQPDAYKDKNTLTSYIPRENEMRPDIDYLTYEHLDLIKIGGI